MRHLYLGIVTLFLVILKTYSQNPIISYSFTADPTARVFDGKVYLYSSHDIKSPVERLKDWFLSQNNVPWVDSESYSMWAPDCVYKNGKYYFYFPAKPKNMKVFSVGVAVSDTPYGPFMPDWKPIEGIQGIDPCVLIDKQGSAYIYWAGNGLRMARVTAISCLVP